MDNWFAQGVGTYLPTGQDIIGSGKAKARKIEEFFSLPSPPSPPPHPPLFKLPGYAGYPFYYWPFSEEE